MILRLALRVGTLIARRLALSASSHGALLRSRPSHSTGLGFFKRAEVRMLSTRVVDPNVVQMSSAPEGNVAEADSKAVCDTWSATRPFDSVMTPKLESLGDFLEKYPESDGRGVKIAILDTGVDPKLEGMQFTSTGERKLIGIYDCSGAGDVDCSHSVTAKDGKVTGLTGRILNVSAIKGLNNPSGKFYLGTKPIHELYVKGLKATMLKERHQPNWESSSNLALANARRLLEEHEKEVGGKASDRKERLKREDLACRVDFVKDSIKKEDKGPVADVLLWHDGTSWKALLDTSFRGKLGMCTPMGPYAEKYEFAEGTIDGDQLTYGFNVYADEKKVEIVTVCGSHGSHVASIAAANYKENPALNGLAPGAKVISICIGDARLGSTETGTALTRAFNLCRELGVDVINMSYGEGVDFDDKGRVIAELKKLLEHGKTLFISSAGNNGPALSSVGCPGGTTSGVIGVGALLLPNQLSQIYGAAVNVDEPAPFLWSSCGPASDGADGVSIYAPGAAFAEVPKYTRKCNQLMNGTSMSSPNAAGAIACLLSKIKQEDKNFSPYEIRLGLEQSGTPLKGCMAKMMRVSAAYDFLTKYEDRRLNLHDVKVACRRWGVPGIDRGIYLRDHADFHSGPLKFTITVEPLFTKSATPSEKTNFMERLTLELLPGEGSLPHTSKAITWQIPDILNLTSGDSAFSVLFEYNPKEDQEKQHVRGWIGGRDHSGRIVFRVPYTILPPRKEQNFEMELAAGVVDRRLIHVPEDRNIACIQVNAPPMAANERIVIHGVQNIPQHAFRDHELSKNFLTEKDSHSFLMKVVPGRSLELCSTLSTVSYKKLKVKIDVSFHNLLHEPTIHLTTASQINRFFVETVSSLPIEFEPAISLKSMTTYYKPTEMKLEPLAVRDLFADGIQLNRIQLSYKINVHKAAEHQFELGGLSGYLYESPYDDIFFQVFSNTKEYLGGSSSFKERYPVKLEKGEYKVVVQVRHPEEAALEKLKDATLTVYNKLAAAVSLDCYKTADALAAGNGKGKWEKTMLAQTQRATLFVQNVPEDKLGKPSAGGTLRGVFTPFGGEWKDKYTVPVVVHLATAESKKQSKACSMVELEAPKKEKDTPAQELANALRDVKIKHFDKMEKLEEVENLYTEAVGEKFHLPLELAYVKKLYGLATGKTAEGKEEAAERFFEQATSILENCNPQEVLAYFGTQNADASVELAAKKEEFDQKKDAIIEILTQKVSILATRKMAKMDKSRVPATFLETPVTKADTTEIPVEVNGDASKAEEKQPAAAPAQISKELEDAFVELQKFVPLDDAKMHLPYSKYAMANEYHGIAIKLLEKHMNDARTNGKTPEYDEKTLAELANLCGWDHLATSFKNDHLHKVRPNYRPF
ncbi:unnamed protein product, partial [Mesorhabditis spiculigera]